MYIYDGFPNREAAQKFADYAEVELGLEAQVYDEQRDDVDPFPFELTPPVVYVERADDDEHRRHDDPPSHEKELERVCRELGGRYAGT